jgi:hypothetical protein
MATVCVDSRPRWTYYRHSYDRRVLCVYTRGQADSSEKMSMRVSRQQRIMRMFA